ncbi:MAG: sensor histidine kinase [Thermoleophilaceae bacterium]
MHANRVNLTSRTGTLAVGVVAVVMCAITGALTLAGSPSQYSWFEALARISTVAVPIGVGVFALQRSPFERFGRLLILAGGVWFLATLATSDDAVLYSTGRIAHWFAEPVLLYLLLSFPSGRLEGRRERVVVGAAVLLVLTLYLPTALAVDGYPVPAPVASCTADCPANAFQLTASEPAVIGDVVRPLRELLTILLFTAAAVLLAARIRTTGPLRRRTLMPVLAVAWFRLAAFATALTARRLAPDSDFNEASVWLLTLAVPVTAIAFLVGLVRWWMFIANANRHLASRLRAHATPEDLRGALADAFADPSLTIVYWLGDEGGHWGDADGHVLDAPSADGRAVTYIRDGDSVVAAIIHDPALENDRAFVDSATAYAVMTLENHRLEAQTSSLLRAVRESRARIQAAADDERRRIERDLHDGAQQRLVALRIKLELAAERVTNGNGGDAEGAAVLRRLGGDVDDALEEVRSLARGIYPASLADRGLVEGLRAAALRNPLPVTVLAAGVGRHSRAIESAAYFCCLEALQNAAKHGHGATAAVIQLAEDGALHVEVRDDGAGFDQDSVVGGSGFTNMRDRVAAVSGELTITSSPGSGTRVAATIPLSAVGQTA